MNGDGFDDLIVGAYGRTTPSAPDAGRAYVYYGGPGADATADLTFNGEAPDDYFGISVGTGGDVNGDGFDDVIVGADGNDAGGSNAGRAYLYDCNRYFITSPTGGETWNVGATEDVFWLGAERADVWLSVDGGDSYSLLREGVGGNASNALALTVPHRPSLFAKVKIAPHSPSVLGQADSDSLFTIEASIALLNLAATLREPAGVLLTWETDPGPEDLSGYKIERSPVSQDDWQVLAPLVRETSYHDLTGGPEMRYRLIGVNGLGEELLLGEITLTPRAALSAWPLPYRGGELAVSFLTAGGLGGGVAPAEVAVFDLQGRRVRTLLRGDYEAGFQTTSWDGLDKTGRPVSSGVYFLRAVTADQSTDIKLVVVR